MASDQIDQYADGHNPCRYHVVPSSLVPPLGNGVSKNCPPFETINPCRCGGSMCGYGVHSSIGAGFERTENFSRRGSSQTVIGSTNAPVENTQCRSAPTPLPSICARIGYAMPTRNIHSVGRGISENATTSRHTFSGGAFTSMKDRTTKAGGFVATACSASSNPGTNKSRAESTTGASF